MSIKTKFPIPLLLIAVLLFQLKIMAPMSKSKLVSTTKVALRDIGHRLLLENNDSTSLVNPIIELKDSLFQLSFNNNLSFKPKVLIDVIEQVTTNYMLPQSYLVEVKNCADKQVVYSYIVGGSLQNGELFCLGRKFPNSCFTIELSFLNTPKWYKNYWIWLLSIVLISLIVFLIIYFKKKKTKRLSSSHLAIGEYRFLIEQNKLIWKSTEVVLSKKEGELLAVFVKKPNKIILREELAKKVWEDKGVIVSRSLDTYVSKLRKKLLNDPTINIVNIHGVGYKLELKE